MTQEVNNYDIARKAKKTSKDAQCKYYYGAHRAPLPFLFQ